MSHKPHEGENRQGEKVESKSGQVEKADRKAHAEASLGMEDHNKAVSAHVQEKRLSRRSGATKMGFGSADLLLPLDEHKKGKSANKAESGANKQHEAPHKAESGANKHEVPHKAESGARNKHESGHERESEHREHKVEARAEHKNDHGHVVDYAKQTAGKVSEHSIHIPSFDSGGHVKSGSLLNRLSPHPGESLPDHDRPRGDLLKRAHSDLVHPHRNEPGHQSENPFAGMLKSAESTAQAAAKGMSRLLGEAAHSVGDGISHTIHDVEKGAKNVGGTLTKGAESIGKGVGQAAHEVEKNANSVGKTLEKGVSAASEGISHVPEDIQNAGKWVATKAKNLVDIKSTVEAGVGNAAVQMGKDAITAVGKGVEGAGWIATHPGEAGAKAGEAIAEGSKATEHAIGATGHAIEQGAEATGHAFQQAAEATGKALEQSAKWVAEHPVETTIAVVGTAAAVTAVVALEVGTLGTATPFLAAGAAGAVGTAGALEVGAVGAAAVVEVGAVAVAEAGAVAVVEAGAAGTIAAVGAAETGTVAGVAAAGVVEAGVAAEAGAAGTGLAAEAGGTAAEAAQGLKAAEGTIKAVAKAVEVGAQTMATYGLGKSVVDVVEHNDVGTLWNQENIKDKSVLDAAKKRLMEDTGKPILTAGLAFAPMVAGLAKGGGAAAVTTEAAEGAAGATRVAAEGAAVAKAATGAAEAAVGESAKGGIASLRKALQKVGETPDLQKKGAEIGEQVGAAVGVGKKILKAHELELEAGKSVKEAAKIGSEVAKEGKEIVEKVHENKEGHTAALVKHNEHKHREHDELDPKKGPG